MVVDAFSGDAIPVHLLTQEAFELYFRHLKPQGILAIHVSNRFLDLPRVVEAGAHVVGARAVKVTSSEDENLRFDRADRHPLAVGGLVDLVERRAGVEQVGAARSPEAGRARRRRTA